MIQRDLVKWSLREFVTLGFDLTEHVRFTARYRVKCSRCRVSYTDGIPGHEPDCMNSQRVLEACRQAVELPTE